MENQKSRSKHAAGRSGVVPIFDPCQSLLPDFLILILANNPASCPSGVSVIWTIRLFSAVLQVSYRLESYTQNLIQEPHLCLKNRFIWETETCCIKLCNSLSGLIADAVFEPLNQVIDDIKSFFTITPALSSQVEWGVSLPCYILTLHEIMHLFWETVNLYLFILLKNNNITEKQASKQKLQRWLKSQKTKKTFTRYQIQICNILQ